MALFCAYWPMNTDVRLMREIFFKTDVAMRTDAFKTDADRCSPMCTQDPETYARPRTRKNALHLRSFGLSRPPHIGSVWRPSLSGTIRLTADVRPSSFLHPCKAASRIV